jgi:SAM-dependent methyltransferase
MTAEALDARALFRQLWGESIESLADPAAPTFAALSSEHSEQLRAQAQEPGLAAALGGELVRWLWAHNQFLELDLAAQAELTRDIRRRLKQLGAGEPLADTMLAHREQLAAFLRARLGATPRDVVSAAYTPQLQLAVLGLSDQPLKAPILDVGCGPEAALVRLLRSQGLDARGLDRTPPSRDLPVQGHEVATFGDWLTFDYGEQRWGTVLSHLGFSLYFLHHHLAQRDAAFDYARTYMAILRSLVRGGRFVYTPGLPFLEAMLDSGMYRVERVAFADELRVQSLTDIEQRTGLALSHAVHIERLV